MVAEKKTYDDKQIRIDPTLHRELKILALQKDESLKKVADDAIAMYLRYEKNHSQ
ncbi:hypothetical protein [Virgibacillus siamensis]|uniref:hypothetical protein n=1 Tax=Virgibacillus siamensis TaxID=480071 RepID=UPI00158C2D87|nr:hypothetical protein [Virgibacillus siamensis]